MKHTIYLLLYFSLAVLTCSCKKSFLDVEDNSVILAEQYVKDLNTAQHYLNGVYHVLRKDFYHGYNQAYPELIADNLKPRSGSTTLVTVYNWQQIPSSNSGINNGSMNQMWQFGYQIARSCSFVIEKLKEFSSENPATANKLQAEALSLRAFVHFIMVNHFAQSYNFSPNAAHPGIPYVTTINWTEPLTRNTVAQVYREMTNDLTTAIYLFPTDTRNTLVMNKHAAKALLARIFLFKEDWQKAKDLAIEVANMVPLMSGSAYPSKLFTTGEIEALFQLIPNYDPVIPSNTTNFLGRYLKNGTFVSFMATIDIVNALTQNPQDVRSAWIKRGGTGSDTVVKYPVNVAPGFPVLANSYYPTLLRSSEMFLTVSEAAAKLGDENTARTYLDAIRQRANPTAANSIATGTALLDSIYLERRKELAFEGLRMFDLLRWKHAVTRMDVNLGSPANLPYPSNKAIAPIPITDAANGISQNPGY